jgi:acyl-CoA oxidase
MLMRSIFIFFFLQNRKYKRFAHPQGDSASRILIIKCFKAELGKEIHAISCASKPLSSWTAQQIIQECREACGGHGYLVASRFAEFRNNNDPLLTFEGDNNVLLQQTSSYLLAAYDDFLKNRNQVETPLNSIDFLNNFNQVMNSRFAAQTQDHLLNVASKQFGHCIGHIIKKFYFIAIKHLYDWLLCHLIKSSYERVSENLKSNKDTFTARNDSQVYFLKSLSIAFIEVKF